MPPKRRSARLGGSGSGRGEGNDGSSNENPDIAAMIAQQLAALVPTIVTQVASAMASENGGGAKGNGANNNGNSNNGCTYKEFTACNPKEFDGKGGTLAYTQWVEKMEAVIDISNCAANQRIKYVTGSLTDKALTWWNTQVQARGRESAVSLPWDEFKALMQEEFCPKNEMQKLESELWNHAMIGAEHAAYTDRFHELAKLVPHLVTPESQRVKRYIYGLVSQIRGMISATEPPTLQSAILKAGTLTDEMVRNGTLTKRKEPGESSNQVSARTDHKKARNGRIFATTETSRRGYEGHLPKCDKCNFHHRASGPCRVCTNCNQLGHLAGNCRTEVRQVVPLNTIYPRACYECGDPNHFRNTCPRLNRAQGQGANNPNRILAIEGNNTNQGNNGNPSLGRAFVIGANENRQDPNIVTGTPP